MPDKQELLENLKKEMSLNDTIPLKENATNLVLGKGSPNADIMFVGEAPGKNEDLQGIPFVGAAGKNLDSLLEKVGLTINDVYIANILKYRPPNNRNPNKKEIVQHTPFLIKQIEIINPKIIVPLGNYATKFVLGGFEFNNNIPSISTIHGKKHNISINKKEYVVIPLYHPAATMYNNSLLSVVKKDFQEIKKVLH